MEAAREDQPALDWKNRLETVQTLFAKWEKAAKRRAEAGDDYDDYDDEEDESDEKLTRLLRAACKLALLAHEQNHPELEKIVRRVQDVNTLAVNARKKQAFRSQMALRSFGDKPDSLVKDSMHAFSGASNGDALAKSLANFFGDILGRRGRSPSPPSGRTLIGWQKHTQPHPQSTRLSRFREEQQFPPADEYPLANAVYQARCEIRDEIISSPIRLFMSEQGSCLAALAAGGYKQRDPMVYYWLPNEDESNIDKEPICPPLIELAHYAAMDDSRKLMFVADRFRVKSFSWEGRKNTPVHTLNSESHRGPLIMLPNGRILRAGVGSALSWTIDDLETHGPGPKYKRIGKGKYSWANCWRDIQNDDEEHEYSTGSKPHTSIPFADKSLAARNWHYHASTGYMLCAEDPDNGYGCFSLDLEHGGKVVSRYLGHGGTVSELSTSGEDPNLFLTACADGYVRLFDMRQPLPVLTFDVEKREAPCLAAVLAHANGLPVVFTGGLRTEGIKFWDIRNKKAVYELSTGNNSVMGLAWNKDNTTLYAATECEYVDWMGYHHQYRDFEKRSITGLGIKPPITRYENDVVFWPDRAVHTENSFGYAYDAGRHFLFQYSFKENVALDVLPEYGDGSPSDEFDGLF